VAIMSESENMSLKEEESQENHLPLNENFNNEFEQEDDDGEETGEDIHMDLNALVENELETSAGDTEEDKKQFNKQKKKESKEVPNAPFEAFLKDFQNETDLDRKLQLAIDFMEASLAQGGTPHFRNFWEVRRLCLPLFKENISPLLRNQLWNKYSELSKEARKLKEILDEQSAFAVEQIEIAVKALETDIEKFDEQVEKSLLPEEIVFPQTLREKRQTYEGLQKQLNLLNVQASRINALRKELLKTEMRVRQKNKFFQRLSSAGDKVFPKRKELIKEISQQFVEDVNLFINDYFNTEQLNHESLYLLREEIKLLQGLAKVLTLNTSSFTQTRMRLSECWDKIKVEEKERKKERAQQRSIFRQNADAVQQHIQAFKEELEQGQISISEAQNKIDDIVNFMRQTELGRDELKVLREDLNRVRKLLHDRIKAEEEARQQQENERNRQKKEKYRSLKERAESLVQQHESYEADQLLAERDDVWNQVNDSAITKNEKQEIERILKPLRDIISEKKEQTLLALSEDDRQTIQQLKDILKQRKERRQEIKNQLEIYRKGAGSSSLDFEKAIAFTTQINEEKERLEKNNQGIKEIEEKIAKLQSKIKS
jgi:hypothetical protein